ncbi:MAG: LuxR C-terminal-related transcriptional regulator [Bacillota bacterium]
MQKTKALFRGRVDREFEAILNYPMTVVSAPMGYGKTTAVRQFLDSRDFQVLWLSFLSPDESGAFFWRAFSEQIGRLDFSMGERLRSLGFPLDAPETAGILSALNTLRCTKQTVMVIDDFHLAKNPGIGKILSQIAREELENLHIVVVTRDTTNLDFGEMTSKGICQLFTERFLRFTELEIRQYCALNRKRLADEEIRQIAEYTGGCISLVYLILLGMDKGLAAGMNTTIYELVEKNLYSFYDERIRRFLAGLSVLDSFSARQAEFVTGEIKAEEFLTRLRRENAFVYFDEATGLYKIHNVLLDLLRMKLTNPDEIRELCKRAGDWYLEAGEHALCCAYYWRAGEPEKVLSLLNGTVAVYWADFPGWAGMFRSLPVEMLNKYPIAYLQYVALVIVNGPPHAAMDGIERLEQLRLYYEQSPDIPERERNRILAEIEVVSIFASYNDMHKMIAHTKKAMELLDGASCCMVRRNDEFTFGCPHFLYQYYREAGRLKDVVEVAVRDFPLFPQIADGCGTGCEYLTLAEHALETWRPEEAELNVQKAIHKARAMEQYGILICAYFTLIRLRLCQGRFAEGLALLGEIRKEATQAALPVYSTTVDLCVGYVNACLRRPERIPMWLSADDAVPGRLLFQGMAFTDIVRGKVVALGGDHIKLEMLTEVFAQDYAIFQNHLGLIHNHILEAVAKRNLYGMDKGVEALRSALDMARADDIVLPFAESAHDIVDMLRAIQPHDQFVKRVLSLSLQYMKNLSASPADAPSLSNREKEVLALARDGLKREEIAERLHISTGTVRTHLQNIYQKLEVSGKTAAIKKAGEIIGTL